jgi:hypothetical protein
MNTKERGDIAVGFAIAYYLKEGYEVCLPIGDKRCYDFVIEKDKILSRVQVKYAGIYKSQRCRAGLRITGGNRSFNYAHKYQDDDFDLLFIHTERKENYEIPWKSINTRNELTVEDKKYKRYKVE